MKSVDRIVVAGLALAVLIVAGIVFLPLWTPIAMAIWSASLLAPVANRISRLAGGRPSVGAASCVVLVFLLFVPVGFLAVSLVRSALQFVAELSALPEARRALESVVEGGTEERSVENLLEVVQTHGATAWQVGAEFAGAGAWALIVVMMFEIALFQFLVDGK